MSKEKEEILKHLNALRESHNTKAAVIMVEAPKIAEIKTELDKITDAESEPYKTMKGKLLEAVKAQQERRDELIEIMELMDSMQDVELLEEIKSVEGRSGAVTGSAIAAGQAYTAMANATKAPMMERIGTDFWGFLNDARIVQNASSIKSREIGFEPIKTAGGEETNFHTHARWEAVFGQSRGQVRNATKSILSDFGVPDIDDETILETNPVYSAVKSYRDATKSMFTQGIQPGGIMQGEEGSLYAPSAIFPGNTGGLCEYEIDNSMEVLPYPKASFLECLSTRQISKSYLLFNRQTLRINNASAVGESVVLSEEESPTGEAVDFRPIKPESKFGFSQARAFTLTFADTQPLSEEFLEDCPQIADIVEVQLMENVRQVFYNQILNGDGTTGEYPQLIGIFSTLGLSTRVHQGAASFMGVSQAAGQNTDTVRDTLEKAIFDAVAFGYSPNCIIMNQADYVDMIFEKDGDEHRLYTPEERTSINGVPIKFDVRVPSGMALVGDFRRAMQILLRRAMRLDIGWVDNQFKTDMLTLRATMRAGIKVGLPGAIIRVTGV